MKNATVAGEYTEKQQQEEKSDLLSGLEAAFAAAHNLHTNLATTFTQLRKTITSYAVQFIVNHEATPRERRYIMHGRTVRIRKKYWHRVRRRFFERRCSREF